MFLFLYKNKEFLVMMLFAQDLIEILDIICYLEVFIVSMNKRRKAGQFPSIALIHKAIGKDLGVRQQFMKLVVPLLLLFYYLINHFSSGGASVALSLLAFAGLTFPAYLFANLSTLPAASTNFCFPVKNGWHFEHISTWIFCFVERVCITSPHTHAIVVSLYSGCILSLIFSPLFLYGKMSRAAAFYAKWRGTTFSYY